MKKRKRIVVVGAGISGLTAAAYLLRTKHEVIILEKNAECGGLVSSFRRDGFLFDAGPRALGNAGILMPMLDDLGIDLSMGRGEVSTGIQDRIVHHDSRRNIDDYLDSLKHLFPDSSDEIKEIGKHIKSNTRMARTLNKVANPFFKTVFKDMKYLFTELLPWLPSFLAVVARIGLSGKSLEEVLNSITDNRSLSDMVGQHFFKGTPANFAFGYFENFQDYQYPPGGTGRFPEALAGKILAEGGIIQNNTEVRHIDPVKRILTDQHGSSCQYDVMLWTADLKTLYRQIDPADFSGKNARSIENEKNRFLSAGGGESVFSIFLAVNEQPSVFRNISGGHFIYTPRKEGLGELHRARLRQIKSGFSEISKNELFLWLKDFCAFNSYEISIPVLKDETLAPPDRTGLIISLLFDGELFRMIYQAGWYDEFREKTAEYMLETLDGSIYPGITDKIIFMDSATPLTLMNRFGSTDGAITGWSLEEKPPVPHSLSGIMPAVKTGIPFVYKAGQWAYSPSGVPIAILTGRIAARLIRKAARRL